MRKDYAWCFHHGEQRVYCPCCIMGIAQLAEKLGINRDTLARWIERHEDFPGPVVKLGRGNGWYYPEVKVWIVAHIAALPKGRRNGTGFSKVMAGRK